MCLVSGGEVLTWGGGMAYSITKVVCFTFIYSTWAMVHIERSGDNIPESVFSSYHVDPENQTQHFRDWTLVLNIFTQWGISQAQILSIYLPGWRDTQQLRTPAALPKDLAQFSVPTHWLTTVCSFSSTRPDTLFWCKTDNRHTCGATYIHIKLN